MTKGNDLKECPEKDQIPFPAMSDMCIKADYVPDFCLKRNTCSRARKLRQKLEAKEKAKTL